MIFDCPDNNGLPVLAGNKIFDEFEFFELTQVMRQKGDKLFIDALNSLARNEMTEEQIALFNTRRVKENEVPNDAIRLHYYNEFVEEFNNEKIDKHPSNLFESTATYNFNSKLNTNSRSYINLLNNCKTKNLMTVEVYFTI